MMQSLSEATAIRLFNSVIATGQNAPSALTMAITPVAAINEDKSTVSVRSSNELGSSCRICRWNRSDMQIYRCPCLCKGSVGFVHMQCLKRWIMHRRDNRCEICNVQFNIPEEKVNFGRMLRSFMSTRCVGAITKHLLFSASLMPLANVVLQQVMICMENLNQNPEEPFHVNELVVACCSLLTSSLLFFHFFEFITTRFLLIRNILRQWWNFGNTSEFSLLEIHSESLDLF